MIHNYPEERKPASKIGTVAEQVNWLATKKFTCPLCQAVPGEVCKTLYHNRRPYPHQQRIKRLTEQDFNWCRKKAMKEERAQQAEPCGS